MMRTGTFGRFLFCVTALAAALALPAHSAPVQKSASLGEARAIVPVNSSEVYVGTIGGGVWKTTNAGVASPTWTRVSTSSMRYVNTIAALYSQTTGSATVYVGTTKGVFKTTNSGTGWTQLTFDDTKHLAVDPSNVNIVLAAVKGLGIARSTDGGVTWTLVGTSTFDSVDTNWIVFQNSSTVYAGFDGNNAANWGGVYKSTNGGVTWVDWNQVGGALGNKFVKSVAVDLAGSVYAGTFNGGVGGIYKQSGTAGGAWALLNTAAPDGGACGGCPYNLAGVQALHLDRNIGVSPGRVWAGSGNADGKGGGGGYSMWRSSAGNNTFGYAWQTQNIFGEITAVATFPDVADRLWAGISGIGLVEATNLTNTVQVTVSAAKFAGIKADRANDIEVVGTTYYMTAHGAGVYQGVTSGTTWSQFDAGLEFVAGVAGGYERIIGGDFIAKHPLNNNILYMTTTGHGLYTLTLPATTWTPVVETGLSNTPTQPVPRYIRSRDLVFDPSGNLYLSLFQMPGDDAAGVYRRDITNNTWSRVIAGPWPGNSGMGPLVPQAGNNFLAIVNETFPYFLANGVTPTQFNDATMPHLGFWRLYFQHAAWSPAASGTFIGATNKGLYISFNSGANWTALGITTPGPLTTTNFSSIALSPSVGNRLFAGTYEGKLYCSNNAGFTWSATVQDFYSPITRVKFIGSSLYVTTDGSGMFVDSSPACS